MTPEQAAAYVSAQTALFNCEVAGMVAENTDRVATNLPIRYLVMDFKALAARYEGVLGHNAVIGLFNEVSG